jgi:chemosensory pili system protein ChpE
MLSLLPTASASLVLFASAFAMSVAFAAQPGVITFEAIRRGLARGWRPALLLEFGSLIGDATWALLAMLGAAVLFQHRAVAVALGLFGAVLLLRFAWNAWQAARVWHDPAVSAPVGESGRLRAGSDFLAGAALSLSNPANITFWLGMSGTMIGMGFLDPQPGDIAIFFAGFMSAQFVWAFVVAGLIALGRRALTPGLFRWINRVCALVLLGFGVSLVLSTIGLALGG